MTYRKEIQESLDYIEAHLQTDITASELAQRAGFSLFHFYRLFQMSTGLPVMQYILRRRLLHAIYAIRGGEKRIDAALAYGFDTYAGFYKAFRREFGCTPSVFLKKNRAKSPARIDLQKEEAMYLMHSTAREVLKQWEMENETITDLYYESSGNRADHAVCVGENFILKRVRELAALKAGMALAQELNNAGVDAQTPIATADGRNFVQMGEWHYSLYRRPEGKELVAADLYGKESAIKARFVGEVIGQLHLTLRKAEIECKEADLLASVRDWALPKAKESLRLSEAFCQSYLETFEKLYSLLPRQIIHRNPNPANILTAEDGWGMIDFEMAERNARLYDPCYAATAVLSESFDAQNEDKLREWLGICQNILLGYDTVAELTVEEKEAVPYMILANQFTCVAWFASQPQYQEICVTNRKMTKWLIQHFEELKLP